MGIETTKDDVVWHIGDRHKDVKAAIAADEHVKGTIIPVAYGLNASIAILENNLSPDHIIMSYTDLHDRLRDMFKNGDGQKKATKKAAPAKTKTSAKTAAKSKAVPKPKPAKTAPKKSASKAKKRSSKAA